MMSEPHVQFQPQGRKVPSKNGRTLLDLANDAGLSIESICGGVGVCAKCKVIVRSGIGSVTPLTSSEKEWLDALELASGMRLACQATVCGDGQIVVEVPQASQRGHHRLLEAGTERKVRPEPAITKVALKLPPATLKDLRADDDRLLEILARKVKGSVRIAQGVHAHLPSAIRKNDWTATVTLFRRSEIIRVEPGDTSDQVFGVAVDIGTTKVVAYLVDLRTGALLHTESMPNPQIPFGEDVIARITYATKNEDGLSKLQTVVASGINELILKLCESRDITPDDILETMIVGNTAMHHVFFGITPQHLAAAPYAPAVRTSLCVDPSHVKVNMYQFGKVCSLPNIAGFVGADAVSDLIASGLYEDRKIGMMIDIGTNTEIIAGNKNRLISCSCASGPAFEGAHIRFGMRAATGAIERVWIDPESHEVRLRTVDDSPPKGICGSGIVDAVAELFKNRLIDASGKINVSSKDDRTRKGKRGLPEFVLATASESGTGEEITITQHDIQEIQLAKAAIFTGVSILMKKLRLRASEIDRVYAAGAFGTYVDAASAIAIGMYPDVSVERISFIGNAAGSGARMCLKSTKMRDLADELSKKVEYVELAAEKNFQSEFAQAMFLPHRDLSRFPGAASRLRGRP
jgi:uncharacterized 2Fe-2S/4Fe-4S cluster protein (DUF4445 family)